MRRWLGAVCALALMCVCASLALGQASASDSKTHSSSAKRKSAKPTTAKPSTGKARTAKSKTAGSKTAGSKSASPKKHTTAAAKGTRSSSSSSAKSRAASHPSASTHSKSRTATAGRNSKLKSSTARKSGKKKMIARGQQKIDPERAQAIQEALIREHYLSGEPAGKWDEASEEAMRRYQADHGWQSKTVPDSRALISLGLGPSHDHLLNPESAMTTQPAAPRSETSTPTSNSADPGARVNTTSPAAQAPAASPERDSSSPQ